MEAAITLPAGPSAGLFSALGGAMFARVVRVLGDQAAAATAAEALFVRFLVYADGPAVDERARWNWIYRVGTSHALRQLSDDARPGGTAAAPWPNTTASAASALPEMRILRRLDEATQSMVVLSVLDGLATDEIAEVLGLPAKLVGRRLESSGPPRQPAPLTGTAGSSGGPHPSLLSLQRHRAANAEHMASCSHCRAALAEADRLASHFASALAPAVVARVAAAVRQERARRNAGPKWKRIAWLAGGFAVVAALALLVARPRSQDRGDVPYAGVKGASRTKASGIQISVGHGAEIRPLEPTAALQPGDRLFFRVKAERPRYLVVRVQDARGERRIFPATAPLAAPVKPGQTLDVEYAVEAPPGIAAAPGASAAAGAAAPPSTTTVWIIGLFGDAPFAADQPPGPEVEIVPVRVHVQLLPPTN
ncbi:MAG: sigma factor-like helix-turn-helix DNA-binding protein [Myxococcales bacterium]